MEESLLFLSVHASAAVHAVIVAEVIAHELAG